MAHGVQVAQDGLQRALGLALPRVAQDVGKLPQAPKGAAKDLHVKFGISAEARATA
jgi:hypothetical protein